MEGKKQLYQTTILTAIALFAIAVIQTYLTFGIKFFAQLPFGWNNLIVYYLVWFTLYTITFLILTIIRKSKMSKFCTAFSKISFIFVLVLLYGFFYFYVFVVFLVVCIVIDYFLINKNSNIR